MVKKVSRKYQIGATVFILLASLTSAGFGIYIGKVVDTISNSNKGLFFSTLILLTGILAINILSKIGSKWCVYKNASEKIIHIKNKVYGKEMKNVDSANIDSAKFSSKTDIIFNDDFLSRWMIFENLLLFVFSSIAIIYINWIMFGVIVMVSLVTMLPPIFLKKYVQKSTKNYSDGISKYLNLINSTLSGRKEIIRYNVFDKFNEKHTENNKATEGLRVKSRFAKYNVGIITEGVGNATFTLVFLVGGLLSFNGYLAIGGLIAIIQLMNNIVRPVVAIGDYKNKINSCKPIYDSLYQSGNTSKRTLSTVNDASDMVLEINNLNFGYSEGHSLIKGLSKKYYKGKKYLVQGESGCGKSTLAKLMAGELTPRSGKIEINERHFSKESNFITYVDQNAYMFNVDLNENISLFREIDKDRIINIKKDLNIYDIASDKNLDDANTISGGQKARVSLARAVVKLPEVLIVDEPTAALDTQNEINIMSYLTKLPITVIVISHAYNEEIVKLFDEVITV